MGPVTATVVLFCGTCREDSAFEQPECLDGHGPGCPEWICVACGDAVLLRFGVADRPMAAATARRVA
jgi:hypothetical protein